MHHPDYSDNLSAILCRYRISDLLIVSDLDDTLLNSRHELDEENRQAIRELMALGGHFSVASGRSDAPVKRLQIPTDYPSVLFNGSAVFDLNRDTFLWTMPLEESIREFVVDLMKRFPGIGIEAVTKDGNYSIFENPEVVAHYTIEGFEPVLVGCAPEEAGGDWMKVILNWPGEKLREVEQYLTGLEKEGKLPYNFGFSYPTMLELLHPKANKGLALRQLSRITGISLSNIIALGDNMNDLEMMQTAGIRIVPANAREEIRACADHIGADNDHHLMADVLALLKKYCRPA